MRQNSLFLLILSFYLNTCSSDCCKLCLISRVHKKLILTSFAYVFITSLEKRSFAGLYPTISVSVLHFFDLIGTKLNLVFPSNIKEKPLLSLPCFLFLVRLYYLFKKTPSFKSQPYSYLESTCTLLPSLFLLFSPVSFGSWDIVMLRARKKG